LAWIIKYEPGVDKQLAALDQLASPYVPLTPQIPSNRHYVPRIFNTVTNSFGREKVKYENHKTAQTDHL